MSDARAIEAVLQAEREAERAVADAAERAERLLVAARERARRIGERADERVKKLHARSTVLADETIEELRGEYQDRARESERTLSDEALLRGAVERVVAWLLDDEAEP